ncbi:MAG TPA: cyclic nucleotide-binding domain-containing protein [Mycobacterium sp.]|nr:cyclic nucleotide-binding domain-containing protein [Mycobacterium sp.]
MSTLEDILAEHPLFSDLDPRYIQLVAACASEVHYNEGDVLFRQDEKANNFYLICEGKIALQIHAPGRGSLTVQTLEDGEILGYSWLIPPHYYRFDGRAVKATHAIVLDGTRLRPICEEDYKLGYQLVSRIASILGRSFDATRHRLLDVYSRLLDVYGSGT